MAQYKKNRHPTKKDVQNPTYTHTPISLGKKERALLGYLYSSKESRFNLKGYSRKSNTPRSTIYDMLDRLISKQFAKKNSTANYAITEQGITALDVSKGSVGASRKECRDGAINLSTHFLRYEIPILNREKFSELAISKANPVDWKKNVLKNLTQYFIYFEDATLIVNPKQAVIRLHDIVTENTEESNYQSFNKALKYSDKLEKIGIIGKGMYLERAHYARVKSILADTLSKVDDRFFIDLGKGRLFWIDNSPPNDGAPEDETNDIDVRERYDSFFKDMTESGAMISDVDKIVKALSYLTDIERLRTKRELEQASQMKQIDPKEQPTYFG